jgi:RecJ-like exonuclease
LEKTARKIADYIKTHETVEIVTHQDADEIAAGSITKAALVREGIQTKTTVLKQLDETFLQDLDTNNNKLFWFTDLGSGNLELLTDLNVVITDHHEIQITLIDPAKNLRTDLMELGRAMEKSKPDIEYHFNPHLFEKGGAYDLSGAGAAYLVAREMNSENIELSALAIIGAVGDLQDDQNGKLVGTNRKILKDAEKIGIAKGRLDIRLFGRETRPLPRFLMYASDPVLPGLSKNEQKCIDFFKTLGIPIRNGEKWRCWIDLNSEERKSVISELSLLILNQSSNPKLVDRLIGEIYYFPKEQEGTELHDAKEFATLLNSCGRYQAAEVGIELCLGNRTDALVSAKKLLKGHRSNLVSMLKVVKDIGISDAGEFSYFHAEERISENIIGTIAGMVLNSGDIDSAKPLIAFANCDDGKNVKVSARAARHLSDTGLNLSSMIHKAAEKVNGFGGGHAVAAGGQIPLGTESEFITNLKKIMVNMI